MEGYVSEHKLQLFDEVINQRTRHISVVLEDIYQSQNASAVIRSCDCFGIQDLHVIENSNTYELNPKVVMGASKWIDLHRHNAEKHNTKSCVEDLKSQGYKIIATAPNEDCHTIDSLPLDDKVALFFGTELTGLSEEVFQSADEFVKVPMRGFTESFNISVSVALVLYELTNRLRKEDIDWQLSELEKKELKYRWVKKVIKRADMIEEKFISEQV